jgi:hypothetical protein
LKTKKIFILLPDGVGLRNFAFTSFADHGKKIGWDVIFWNHTPFRLSELGIKEIPLSGKPKSFTDLYKRAKIEAELDLFEKIFQEPIYSEYKFSPSRKGWKNKVKNFLVSRLKNRHSDKDGIRQLRNKLEDLERKGEYYKHCYELLKIEKPDLVFCTNQRAIHAVAPITAAKDLNIPTSCFIFSWDNLPKATKIVEADYYCVWSDYMKKELQSYYPYIIESQIKVTGSPQFEHHYCNGLKISKEKFYNTYGLEDNRAYLCYSGDDITTAPHDELYLRDTAEAVRKLNSEGENIGIIFRRCPVDNSGRYNEVLKSFKDVIVPIEPEWKQLGEEWNSVLPSKNDLKLQTNIVQHTFMVINVGSSMVFDYATHGLPCAYINYNPDIDNLQKDTTIIYNYIHFRSMPSKESVLWVNEKEDLFSIIKAGKNRQVDKVSQRAKEWFEIVNKYPSSAASERIWNEINKIFYKCI